MCIRDSIKTAREGRGGFFPRKIAEMGARVQVQEAKASREEDRTSILRAISHTDEPPKEHPRYVDVNTKVQSLFRGAAIYSHALVGNVEGLRELLEHTSEGVTYRSADGSSPLFSAAKNGHTAAVEVLARAKADLNEVMMGRTPVFMAARNGHAKSVEMLGKLGADVNQACKGTTPTYAAARFGHTASIEMLAKLGADVNQADNEEGATPVFVATREGHKESIELLAKLGADVNQTDSTGVLSLIHISEPTRLLSISYAVFCLKKKKHKINTKQRQYSIYK
eukprot:TRINITY_DN61025_c0_g1_i1.p1 TRINITY_DN61025_c0_g1~~TRINITY_DN61025_c0_g1_i1.p1  ORF type:complete len:281 (+),score=59.18 TRINITY_DN61025_c0_g1_i1:144-986(+)